MTKEHRIIFGLSDIKCIRLKCGNPSYKEASLLSVYRFTHTPPQCPHSRKDWMIDGQYVQELNFISVLREMVQQQSRAEASAEIQTEIEDLPERSE